MKRRLVIAAHADDETIGCGGMISKYTRSGADIFVGVLTVDADKKAHNKRLIEAQKAWAILGVTESDWAMARSHPLTVNEKCVDTVTRWLDHFHPDIVFVPDPNEQDPDHAVVAQIVKSAMLRSGYFCQILGYEVWTPLTRPSLFEDISEEMPEKKKAIRTFATQVQERDYAASAESLNRFRGVMTGRGHFVEAFSLVQI